MVDALNQPNMACLEPHRDPRVPPEAKRRDAALVQQVVPLSWPGAGPTF